MELINNLCNLEDQILVERLKKYILPGPTLARSDPSRRFYINIYWSKDGIGEVIMQADVSEEAINPEAQEKDGAKCEFYKSLK